MSAAAVAVAVSECTSEKDDLQTAAAQISTAPYQVRYAAMMCVLICSAQAQTSQKSSIGRKENNAPKTAHQSMLARPANGFFSKTAAIEAHKSSSTYSRALQDANDKHKSTGIPCEVPNSPPQLQDKV